MSFIHKVWKIFKIRKIFLLLSIVVPILSVCICYCIMEVGYRIYTYYHLRSELIKTASAVNASGPRGRVFDEALGFRYVPNFSYKDASWNSWKTNSLGHVSNEEYPRQKPSSEYRIVVIGDSFAAGIMSNVRWTDVLQEKLNANKEWKGYVGGKFIRVINCGLDGISFVQFENVLKYEGLSLQPDLVVVNFITDDIKRQPYSVRIKRFASEEEKNKAIKDFICKNYLNKIN